MMQALLNFESELTKAFEKMQADFENHAAVFQRLEADLEAVKGFELQDYTETLAAMRKQDSKLYKAIRAAYEQEQFETNGDAMERHCQGMIAAVNAIYNLGYGEGFKNGAAAVKEGEK